MLNSIQKNITIHKPNELVVCIDSSSWRKKCFQYYKANREQARENSDFDFTKFYEHIDTFVNDLREYFPYKVLKVPFAEADDIIAILVYHLKEKNQIVVCSSDKDMRQLLQFENVKLWSMSNKDWVDVKDPKHYLICHILKGDSGDGVPNFLSDDDTYVVKSKRAKPCGDKKIQKILEHGLQEWITENDMLRNWKRNKKLVELSPNTIPKSVADNIIRKYEESQENTVDFIKVLQYLRKNQFKTLESYASNFLLKSEKEKTILEKFDF